MRPLISLALTLSTLFSLAQYNNPYRLTWDGTNYLVTNKGNGTVVQIDSNFNTSTVISSLYQPNDIFFGTIAGNSAIAIIDSNQVKLFDPSTFSSIINLTIGGAVEAHDGVFNPNNSNEFFISDRTGNKIIKGSIGAAPFYPITYTTFVSNITRPTGMIINSSGHLIVVSDTTDAKIHRIDISTGADSVWNSTNLDYLNDVVQDNEGNYYVTSWGDNYLYRLDSNMNNPYRLIAFNDPSGMFVNSTYDYLAMCCFLCNKVEFKSFHLYSPLSDISTCENDSFYIDFNPIYSGIGTYNSNNQFVVELSDSNGNYSAPTTLHILNSDTVPASLQTVLPSGAYAKLGHRYRVRSTSPQTLSYFDKVLGIKASPPAYAYSADTLSICVGSTIVLGNAGTTGNTYDWTPGQTLTDSTISNPTFKSQPVGSYNLLLTELGINGCSNSSALQIIVGPKLSIPQLKDSLAMCPGDSLDIGVDGLPFFFSWSGSDSLSDPSAGNPSFFDIKSQNMQVIFSDFNLTCSGTDTVYVEVYEAPSFGSLTQTIIDSSCFAIPKVLNFPLDSNIIYQWSVLNGSIDTTVSPPVVTSSVNPVNVTLIANMQSKLNGCWGIDSGWLKPLPLPPLQLNGLELIACSGDSIQLPMVLDSAYQYDWPERFYTVDDTASVQPTFYSATAGRWIANTLLVTDANACTNFDRFDMEFLYVPSDLSLISDSFNSNTHIALADQGMVNELNEISARASILWYVNGSLSPASLDTIGWFDRDDFSHGDTLQAHIYRIVDGDTLCDFWTTEFVKTNLGSIRSIQNKIALIPNPVSAMEGSVQFNTAQRVEEALLFSMDGRSISFELNGNHLTFDAKPGIYVVRIRLGNRWYNSPLVVQ